LDKAKISYNHDYLEDYSKVSDFYATLDMYIIASRIEGGPLSLMESWASGVPLVTTNMGQPRDAVTQGFDALMAEVDDVNKLAEYASSIIEDKKLAQKLVINGLETVKKYSWEVIAESYYQEMYLPLMKK
jgi:glycosyltransferase involved in cell wall biosynthesis